MSIITQIKSLSVKHKVDSLDVQILVSNVLKINRAGLYVYDKNLTRSQEQQVSKHLELRSRGYPLALILGHKEFWGRDFKVTEDTLIPRDDTETLIEKALEIYGQNFSGRICDLGTGTGCIAITLAKEWPNSEVVGLDKSKKALIVAKQNKEVNKAVNLYFLQSNWYANLKNEKFDLIVSNPPYIDVSDPHLKNLASEPITSLVAENNGLADLELIISKSHNHLNKEGWLIVEHGYNQEKDVKAFFEGNGFMKINTQKDLSGMPRITYGQVAIQS